MLLGVNLTTFMQHSNSTNLTNADRFSAAVADTLGVHLKTVTIENANHSHFNYTLTGSLDLNFTAPGVNFTFAVHTNSTVHAESVQAAVRLMRFHANVSAALNVSVANMTIEQASTVIVPLLSNPVHVEASPLWTDQR